LRIWIWIHARNVQRQILDHRVLLQH
jgi:hypothetical protein